jgi:hypothetical protein
MYDVALVERWRAVWARIAALPLSHLAVGDLDWLKRPEHHGGWDHSDGPWGAMQNAAVIEELERFEERHRA